MIELLNRRAKLRASGHGDSHPHPDYSPGQRLRVEQVRVRMICQPLFVLVLALS
jgi:hypothetical protein